MKRFITHRFRWLFLACSLILLSPLLHASPVAASTPLKCKGWHVVPSPSPGVAGNYLYGVTAISSTAAWAVGEYGPAGGGSSTLTEHWDGSQWNLVPSPNPGTNGNYLYGVAAISSTDVWTVGVRDAVTLIEHWDGTQWSVIPSPNPSSNVDYLYSISAVSSNDVWAVGYSSPPSGGTYILIEHWDGSQWSVVASPSPGPYVNYLYGVAAASNTDVWAVGGYSPRKGGAATLIEHWNGSQWTKVKSPNPGSFANLLYAVSALPNGNVWTVGYYFPNPSTVLNLTEHWTGGHWKAVKSPNPGPDNLRGVALVPGTSRAWAVGYYSNGTDEQTLIEAYC